MAQKQIEQRPLEGLKIEPVEREAAKAQVAAGARAYETMYAAFKTFADAMKENGKPLPKNSIMGQLVG